MPSKRLVNSACRMQNAKYPKMLHGFIKNPKRIHPTDRRHMIGPIGPYILPAADRQHTRIKTSVKVLMFSKTIILA